MPQKTILCFTLLSMMLVADITPAKMRELNKIRVGIPPYEVLSHIVQTNFAQQPLSKRANQEAAPYLTWLADSQPDLRPTLIMDAQNQHKIFSVRNLGPQLIPAAGSLDYGIRELHTPVLLITGNSSFQHLHPILDSLGPKDPLAHAELHTLQGLLPRAGKSSPTAEQLRLAIEKNIDQQVDAALKRYKDRIRSGRLIVVGSLIDTVDVYHCGKNSLIIININGETKEDAMRRHPALAKLNKEMLVRVGRKPRKKTEPLPQSTKENP